MSKSCCSINIDNESVKLIVFHNCLIKCPIKVHMLHSLIYSSVVTKLITFCIHVSYDWHIYYNGLLFCEPEFNLPDVVKKGIQDARAKFENKINSLDMDFVKIENVTKKTVKSYKLSPDSFMQLAIQVSAL